MKFRRKLEEIEAEEYRVGLEDGFSCIPHTCECLRKDENESISNAAHAH